MTEPKRKGTVLLLSAPYLFPAKGGAELRFSRYLPGLQKRGLICRLISGTPQLNKLTEEDRCSDWFDMKVGDILPIEYLGEAPVYRIRLPNEPSADRLSLYYRYLLDVCRDPQTRPDVVQLIADLPASCLSILEQIRALGVPVLYAYTLAHRRSSHRLKRFWENFSLRRHYSAIDCTIANSSANRDELVRAGVKTRIEAIPNGVNLGKFYPTADENEKMELRRKLSCNQAGKIVLSVGAVHPRKGTDLLLEAWQTIARKIPDAHLYLIGMRHDMNNPSLHAFRHSIETLVASSGAPDRIHFLGYVPNVPEYLRAADLLLFPSRKEGMPNAIIEAMASGTPVVTCPFIGISPDLGRPDIDFILTDHSPDAIAKAAIDLLTDKNMHRQFSQSAHRWVVQNMDIGNILDRYAALYHDMASTAHKSP